LDLAPRKADTAAEQDPLEGFKLLIDEHQNLPKGAKITSLGGNVTAITFDKLNTKGIKVDAGKFVLEYPKGVDLVDRRLQPK
jgi:outer membrane lipoprotein-sorting protein